MARRSFQSMQGHSVARELGMVLVQGLVVVEDTLN
jgi:hypothetical protein